MGTDNGAKRLNYNIPLLFPNETLFVKIERSGVSAYYSQPIAVGYTMAGQYEIFEWRDTAGWQRFIAHLRSCVCVVSTDDLNESLLFNSLALTGMDIHVAKITLSQAVKLWPKSRSLSAYLRLCRTEWSDQQFSIAWMDHRYGHRGALKTATETNVRNIMSMQSALDEIIRESSSTFKNRSKPGFNLRFAAMFPMQGNGDYAKTLEDRNLVLNQLLRSSGADLSIFKEEPSYCIVGIDLTGSQEKPSGWAVLEEGYATTKRILSDREILEEVSALRPHLVCIDAPLSLPRGRISPFDDDPGKRTHGIMRDCERILARRGIKSYPSLIRSMQNLTARGISLSRSIREMGIDVIETYPGGAQDVIGIPRKGKSLEHLIRGLSLFGISGEYTQKKVSHDEIDAITCAVVGLFYLNGMSEAIGMEEEGQIIMPKRIDVK